MWPWWMSPQHHRFRTWVLIRNIIFFFPNRFFYLPKGPCSINMKRFLCWKQTLSWCLKRLEAYIFILPFRILRLILFMGLVLPFKQRPFITPMRRSKFHLLCLQSWMTKRNWTWKSQVNRCSIDSLVKVLLSIRWLNPDASNQDVQRFQAYRRWKDYQCIGTETWG